MKKILLLALVVASFGLIGHDISAAAPIEAYTKPAARAAAAQSGELRIGVARGAVPHAAVSQPVVTAEGRRSVRSYSYDPGTAPVMRRSIPARVPSYMLPKSDPRKFNGF